MTRARVRLWILAAIVAAALSGAVPRSVEATNTAGYMVLNSLSESFESSGNVITLTGTITNACTSELKPGSVFDFEFDNVAFTGFTITALAYGQSQDFSVYGTLPQNLPPPKKNTTSLDFAILLPKTGLIRTIGEQKASPCLVTLQAGVPEL